MDINNVFLEILRAGLQGRSAGFVRELTPKEWEEIFRLAQIHKLLPLVYNAVCSRPDLQKIGPAELRLKSLARSQVAKQVLRTEGFFELNCRLQEAGVRPLVVKGITCRSLYPEPDLRSSSDEDLLIRDSDFEICHQIMTELGLQTEKSSEEMKDAYEIPYRKAGGMLYIELHRNLFPPDSRAYGSLNGFFDGVFERAEVQEIQGNTVWTLAPTDHLFYLICHAFKHFLHSGFGIRQICDIVLYANQYGVRIDWQQIQTDCRRIRGEKFAAAIFRIGEKYLGFDPIRAACPTVWRHIPVNEQPMLEDLLSGGIYGGATMSRKHSSNITLEAVAAQKEGRKKKNSLLVSLFPPSEKLEGRYPWLKRRPWLLPAAWVNRLVSYSAKLDKTGQNSASNALKIGNERTELLKEYGILE